MHSSAGVRSLYVTHPARISSGAHIVSPNSPPHHQQRLYRGREPVREIGSHACAIPHAVSRSPRLVGALPEIAKTKVDVENKSVVASTFAEPNHPNKIENTFALTEGFDHNPLISCDAKTDRDDGFSIPPSHRSSGEFPEQEGMSIVEAARMGELLRSPPKSRRRISLPAVNYVGCDPFTSHGSYCRSGSFSGNADIGFTVVARKAGEQKIKEVLKNLGHSDLVGRWATVKTLSQITTKGDRAATIAIAAKLEHSDESVRIAAAKALELVAEKGDTFAIDSVADRLEHPDEHVRTAAMQALPCVISAPGCLNAITSVTAKLTNDEAAVRTSVGRALHFIAERGDPNVLKSIIMRLDHENEGVRKAAGDALAAMSHNASTLASLLEHSSPKARAEAILQFGECVEKGDKDAVIEILKRFSSRRAVVRKAAVAAISKVVVKGDIESIDMVICMLEDPNERVRNSAVEALSRICRRDDPAVIEDLSKRLEHGDVNVRAAATRALVGIVRPGNRDAVRAVAQHLGNENESVRLSAGRCLGQLTSRGHKTAISTVANFLQHDDPHIRRTAVRALGELVNKDNEEDTALVMSCFLDVDCHVRQAALSSMKCILEASAEMVSTPHGVQLKGQTRPTLILKGRADFKASLWHSISTVDTILPSVEEDALRSECENYTAIHSWMEEETTELNADTTELTSTELLSTTLSVDLMPTAAEHDGSDFGI